MRKLVYTILACFFFAPTICQVQFSRKVDSLSSLVNNSSSDADKIRACGQLAELYYIYQLDRAGDSMLQKQLKIAEFTGDRALILSALFGTAITNVNSKRSNETFDKALQFIQKGRDYAKAIGREDYLTLAYTRMATLYRKRGQLDNAFYNANVAFTSSLNIDDDSIKVITTIELGDVYQAKGEALLAYKTYTNAYDRAVDMENICLQAEVYHRYSNLYYSLGNQEQARENLLRSLELNKTWKRPEGMISDYIDLARRTNERSYIEKALFLADSLSLEKYIIQAKGIMFGYYTYVIANSDSTLQFINRNKDLQQVYMNGGLFRYYWRLGSVFHYANRLDSAIYYLRLAEPGIEKDFDGQTRQSLYEELGDCYRSMKKPKDAIAYYEKAISMVALFNDPVKTAGYSLALSKLYEEQGDYKNAVAYARKKDVLNDSLQKLSSQRDIAMIEVNNEKKKHEKELEALAQHKLVKRNLQYMAITVVITLIFIFMIVMGMFPISKLSIKLLGYFAFISLFEFIVLLIDSFLHNLAHGEPLKIWLMKIFLIAMLVPFQHYLEKGMIKFIESRRLHKLRHKLSLKKWRLRRKKTMTATLDDIEKDTAVL